MVAGYPEIFIKPSEAPKVLRKLAAKRRVFLVCSQEAPIADDPGKVFPVMGHVRVSLRDALKYVADAYGNFEKRGAMLKVVTSDLCLFVGSS